MTFTERCKASFANVVGAYMLRQIICPSVRLYVRHTPVLRQNEGTQRDVVFTLDSQVCLVLLF